MVVAQHELDEQRIRRFASQQRLKHLLSDLDWERFGGNTLNWDSPPMSELMNLAIPLSQIIRKRADNQQRDFTTAEYLFVNAVEKLQI